jgi:cation diffusion facilitator CzcD-associated flavoprotein CzcO
MGSIDTKPMGTDFDVIIVGAGISGINAAYRVQSELPGYSYTILEARDTIGGTWDLFRYPGIRSDSDLHTFGFSWRPWSDKNTIADGTSIRNYLKESAAAYGIDSKIQFRHKLLAADWSSDDQRWSLSVDADGEKIIYSARFIIMGTGYYNYDEPLDATIPGLDNFKGQVVHPQFWPQDLNYTGKKVIIIGSGATAVTMLPVVAEKAAKVTMLQRSPSYIKALPLEDPLGNLVRRFLPSWVTAKILRWKFFLLPFLFYKFCRAFPNAARKLIRKENEKLLPKGIRQDPHFNPKYNPWEQRLCVCPGGDFFRALREANADVVTDHIKTVTDTGILTENGSSLDADIIVTATGLKLRIAGGVRVSIDGEEANLADKFMWQGVMLQDIPNAAVVMGYTNASWTLGADTTARLLARLLKYMDRKGMASAVPRIEDPKSIKEVPLLNLTSTYMQKAKDVFPKAGDVGPWTPRNNYLTDRWTASLGSLTTGLKFTRAFDKAK